MPSTLTSPRVTPDLALAHLLTLDRWERTKIVLLIVFGIPLSFLGPLLVAVVASMAASGDEAPSFLYHFIVSSVIVVPLMYLLAWGMRGSLIEGFAEEIDGSSATGTALMYGVRGRVGAGLLLIDILLFAPRMVFKAWFLNRAKKRVASIDRERAAEALAVLANNDGGIPPSRLLKRDEDPDALGEIFALLLHHDLIDIAKTGERVWMLSEAREKLED